MEKRYIAKNGAIVWGLLAVSLIRDADGKPAYFISQIQDMSHAHEIQQEVEYKALNDPLTGLARSEEHTSDFQSLMSISYAGFCLQKKKNNMKTNITTQTNTREVIPTH